MSDKTNKKEVIQKDIQEMLENDLGCAICQDIYINPLILNCSHSFCKFCVYRWLGKNTGCPQCRMTVSFQAENLALRNVINRMVQKSSPQFQETRVNSVKQRLKDEEEQEKDDSTKTLIKKFASINNGTSNGSNRRSPARWENVLFDREGITIPFQNFWFANRLSGEGDSTDDDDQPEIEDTDTVDLADANEDEEQEQEEEEDDDDDDDDDNEGNNNNSDNDNDITFEISSEEEDSDDDEESGEESDDMDVRSYRDMVQEISSGSSSDDVREEYETENDTENETENESDQDDEDEEYVYQRGGHYLCDSFARFLSDTDEAEEESDSSSNDISVEYDSSPSRGSTTSTDESMRTERYSNDSTIEYATSDDSVCNQSSIAKVLISDGKCDHNRICLGVRVFEVANQDQKEEEEVMKQQPHQEPMDEPPECKRVGHFQLDGKLRLSEVDGSLCTHLLLASWRIDAQANIVPLKRDDGPQFNLAAEVAQFKRLHPKVKVLLTLVNEPDEGGLMRAASSAEIRHKLARSAMNLLGSHQLDGLSLDWDLHGTAYQQFIMGNRTDLGISKILVALREAIVENFYARQQEQQHQQGQKNSFSMTSSPPANHKNNAHNLQPNIEPYILTFSVAGQEPAIGGLRLWSSCELKQVAKLCDWIQIKSYDYFLFKAYAPFAGPIAPLYPIVDPYVPILGRFSLSCTLAKLLDEYEIGRDKIVLGVAAYGRAYRLAFRSNQPSAFSLALGAKLSPSSQSDILSFSEVCEALKRPDTIQVFDERARVPYLLTDQGYTWISCESEQSVREKVRFIKDNQLAGYMSFNLNLDAGNNFPLHRAMMQEALTNHKNG